MQILDGKAYRLELLEEYKKIIEENNLDIRLDIIKVGDNPSSIQYIKNKLKYTEMVGIKSVLHELDENTREDEIIKLIKELNENDEVTGIILQSPIPQGKDAFNRCAEEIAFSKDVDGFGKDNIYNLYMNKETILPCTVIGIIKLLEHYNINLDGASVTIVGRGNIVGKPLSIAMTNRNATVTLCHSHSEPLEKYTKDADIVVAACGCGRLIKKDMVKEGFVGVDVGVSFIDGKQVGDFDESVYDKASYITMPTGGVGPMTISMIINNLINLKKNLDN